MLKINFAFTGSIRVCGLVSVKVLLNAVDQIRWAFWFGI